MLRLDDVEAVVTLTKGIDFGDMDVTVQEGFIMSRVDGTSRVSEICLSSGLGMEATMQILASLSSKGLIMIGDQQSRPAGTTPPPRLDEAPEDLVPENENVQINRKMRAHIRRHYDRLEEMNFFDLLCVEPTTDFGKIRRAFLKRTKEFHPDRYYGRDIGHYHEMIRELFKHVVRAYRFLEDPSKREAYIEYTLIFGF